MLETRLICFQLLWLFVMLPLAISARAAEITDSRQLISINAIEVKGELAANKPISIKLECKPLSQGERFAFDRKREFLGKFTVEDVPICLISTFEIQLGKTTVEIPKAAYENLSDVGVYGGVSLWTAYGMQFLVSIRGADGITAYEVLYYFNMDKLVKTETRAYDRKANQVLKTSKIWASL
jgi:hypothetical protein